MLRIYKDVRVWVIIIWKSHIYDQIELMIYICIYIDGIRVISETSSTADARYRCTTWT